jgi:deazaflavin-dependent oxidoreductase (nitroreductase family)
MTPAPGRPGPARHQEGRIAMADFTEALKSTREVELTAVGRKTGQETSRPVWFDQEGDTLYLVPVTGTDSQWYKNVLRHPMVRLAAGGAEYTAQATPITDPARAAEVVQLFRARYGADDVARFYPNPNVAVEVSLA